MFAGHILAAASGAASSTATASRSGFTFDPVNALPWAVPLLLIVPFATFLLALSSVRTRRSASATAMFGTIVMLLLTLLVAWGVTKKGKPFDASFQYINISVAFSGPTNFQTFVINLLFHVDRVTVVGLLVIEICMIAAIGWHQFMGRSEPGAARFHAAVTALLFGCAGMLLSWDLAELFAFWAISGAVTFLLLAHRWGVAEPAARARVALALPFFTDISLLCGIAWLYSRYGVQDLTSLLPILHTNPGWTVRSLVVASVLLFVGVAGRLALWPFSTWITQTARTAPAAGWAIVQSSWSVAAIIVLYRLTPIFVASNQRTMQALLAACGVAAIVAAVLSLLGNEPRRAIALAGAAVAAIGAGVIVNGGYHSPATFAIAGVAIVLAVAPARAGAVLAIATIANAMRTDDMVEMGDAWRRMRASSGALLVCTLVIAVAPIAALASGAGTRTKIGIALGEAALLVAVAAMRIYFGASFGPLRRRRAFDPDRVREPQEALGWPYWLGVVGAVLVVASLITGWLNFLDGNKHPVPALGTFALWAAVVGVGILISGLVHLRGRDGALAAAGFGGAGVSRVTAVVIGAVARFVVSPVTDIARRVGDWIPAGDGAVGRSASSAGQLALGAGRVPAVSLVILLAIVLAVILALLAPGISR